jgi:hypothetical protein
MEETGIVPLNVTPFIGKVKHSHSRHFNWIVLQPAAEISHLKANMLRVNICYTFHCNHIISGNTMEHNQTG